MADMKLRVAIVDPADISRAALCNMLLGLENEGVWLEADCPRYDFFPEVITQSNPEVAIVALDADSARALQLLESMKRDHPKLPIIAISSRAEHLVKASKNGALELLTHPVGLEDLLEALKRVSVGTREPTTKGQVLSILGSRGGVGCTSIAVNLGCTLSTMDNKSKKVVLMDLDMALGDADVALDLVPDHDLLTVAMNSDRLDLSLLNRSLTEHTQTGLKLLPHPTQMQDLSLGSDTGDEDAMRRVFEMPRVVERVIGLLKTSFTHVLIDLSKGLSPTDMTALHLSDKILLIAQLELTSLRNVVRIMHALGSQGGMSEKLEVIVNRTGSDTGGDISSAKAEEAIGKKIYWQIPNDTRAMLGARNAGVPLQVHAPNCKTQTAIQSLANMLCGKPPVQPRPKGFFG
jgi:pilus assembly protein CpaE